MRTANLKNRTVPPKISKKQIVQITCAVLAGLLVLYLLPIPFTPSIWRDMERRNLRSQLFESSDPVFLPSPDRSARVGFINYHSRFTTYDGWRNAYYIQSIGLGYYYQVSPRSVVTNDKTGKGPLDWQVAFLKAVSKGSLCASPSGVTTTCTSKDDQGRERSFLARTVGDHTLVAETGRLVYTSSSERIEQFQGKDLENIKQMLQEAVPVPLEQARKDRLKFDI